MFVAIKVTVPPPTSSIPLPVIRNERARNVINYRSNSTVTSPSAPSFEHTIVIRTTSIRSANSVPATPLYFYLRGATVARSLLATRDGPSSFPLEERGYISDNVVSTAATARTLPSKWSVWVGGLTRRSGAHPIYPPSWVVIVWR